MEASEQRDEDPISPTGAETKIAKSLFSVDTQYTACSLEFCPSRPNFLVCGLYQTVQTSESNPNENSDSPKTERRGGCLLFEQLKPALPSSGADSYDEDQKLECKQLQKIEGPAILDQRWTLDADTPQLITADAEGFLNSFLLEEHPCLGYPQLRPIERYSCAPEGVLCLALDASDKVYSTRGRQVVTSLSNGEIVLIDQISGTHLLTENSRWHGHEFEAWTCGFDYWTPTTILTGGDDCKWKIWDTRSGITVPTFTNKQFEGGVTAVRSHHLREYIYAVGSYDAGLRLFDKRYLSQPFFSHDMGGGIWRLKWHPTQAECLLVAAMHDGFKVIETPEDSDAGGRILAQFNEHASLAYGADWGEVEQLRRGIRTTVGTCSFYDHSMHLWKFDA